MDERGPVSLEIVFERFPASVRGAIVVRGLDADPHQVTVERAAVTEAGSSSREVAPVSMEPATVDVAPRGEVLVPFDVPFSDLRPGWYRILAEGDVDGQERVRGPEEGKRFLVPWPAEDVRRGEIAVDRTVSLPGATDVVVERVDCRTDRALVRWRHPPTAGGVTELRVLAGRSRLPVLEGSENPTTGERTTVVYPVLKRHRSLTFELQRSDPRGTSRRAERASTTIDLR